mmetsp:Transcript_6198/g.14119  ORF Transcript_6198/g.14119 Transcript_6198/m.14119 type:complete len:109 (-) Transcript_6198:135-461(-)
MHVREDPHQAQWASVQLVQLVNALHCARGQEFGSVCVQFEQLGEPHIRLYPLFSWHCEVVPHQAHSFLVQLSQVWSFEQSATAGHESSGKGRQQSEQLPLQGWEFSSL